MQKTTWAGAAIAGILALSPALPAQLTTVEELVAARAEKRAKPVFKKADWIFDYDETAEDDDEAGYRFGTHAFRPGEYVSIRDEDGEMHTFMVVSVQPVS